MNDTKPDDGMDPRPTAAPVSKATSADGTVEIVEERVVLDKREVDRVAAHIRIRTRSEDVTISEALRVERVEIGRVPVDRIVPDPPETRIEDGVTIIPVFEEVLVRQFRIVEEVHVAARVETIEQAETVTLRRQEVVVDETAAEPFQNTDRPEGP